MNPEKMQYQEQSQKQALKKIRYVGDLSMECPHCGESVDSHLELCPSCGRPLHADHCTFCGARMVPGEKFCSECGNGIGGIKCPKCGTLNYRSFCKKCNEPLDDLAQEAIQQAETDPVYQEVKQQVKELEEVAEKMESEPAAEKEFSLKLASLNDAMQRMQPPPDSTPQMQRTFYSARDVLRKSKVLVKTQVRCGWVCNYCGCTHSCPNECVEPQLGGTWLYDTVTEEKEVEMWTKE